MTCGDTADFPAAILGSQFSRPLQPRNTHAAAVRSPRNGRAFTVRADSTRRADRIELSGVLANNDEKNTVFPKCKRRPSVGYKCTIQSREISHYRRIAGATCE